MSDGENPLDIFIERGRITEVIEPVKSGKEATVYRCRAAPAAGAAFFAAKVYRAREDRSFKNDAVYWEGRTEWRRPSRALRALEGKTRFGREVQQAAWVGHEWETLRALHAAGVPVPAPVDATAGAILMEFFEAPPLHATRLALREAEDVLARLLREIERMLAANVVHGDLSPFNVLYGEGDFRIIDLPQAVDPRFNTSAFRLLARDVENVHRHCARFGARADPARIAAELWGRFVRGEL